MSGQCIAIHQLRGDLTRKFAIETALLIDVGKFIKLCFGCLVQLAGFASNISLLGVCLRAY